MADVKRLTGKDGKLYLATKGAEVIGNGTTKLAKGSFYIPTVIAATSSGFPANAKVGVVLVGDGTSAPASTEKYIPLTNAPQCDITGATVDFSKSDIDITTLCDDIMKYAAGMTELTGSLEGITTLGKSEVFIAKFVDVQKQSSTGAITATAQNDDEIIVALELNKADSSDADVAYFFAPAVLTSFNLGATINEAQTFTAEFRISQDNVLKAAFIEADKALFTAST